MLPRRSLALAAGALLLCLPVLSSCGFDKATDRVYIPANGINYREGSVYVLNAVIAAAQPNSGTLIASFTNQSDTRTATLETVAGSGGNSVQGGDFTPIKIAPRGIVNLADDTSDAVTVSGTFDAGDVIPMSLNFADGKVIEMNVPVVYACQQYTGLDTSVQSASASTSTSTSTSASTSTSTSASTSASTSDSSTPSAGVTNPGDTTATPLAGATASSSNPEQATPSPSDTGSAETGSASPAAGASTYVCGTSGGTGGRN